MSRTATAFRLVMLNSLAGFGFAAGRATDTCGNVDNVSFPHLDREWGWTSR